jgi:hypothetical protein
VNNLQERINDYLASYNLYANHHNNRVYDSSGTERGIYDIKDREDGETSGKVHIAFHVANNEDLEIIPTLILNF